MKEREFHTEVTEVTEKNSELNLTADGHANPVFILTL
jgi:hypothetical protein